VSPAEQNGGGNGNGDGPPDDDFLIRDRDDPFEVEPDHPRAEYDPYADFESARAGGTGGGYGAGGAGFGDRGLIEAIARIIESLAGVAGDALAPEARRQLEKTLRDLLVALRDALDWIIERIDEREEDDFEIEEIPID
jgi:hypothetical protein